MHPSLLYNLIHLVVANIEFLKMLFSSLNLIENHPNIVDMYFVYYDLQDPFIDLTLPYKTFSL